MNHYKFTQNIKYIYDETDLMIEHKQPNIIAKRSEKQFSRETSAKYGHLSKFCVLFLH